MRYLAIPTLHSDVLAVSTSSSLLVVYIHGYMQSHTRASDPAWHKVTRIVPDNLIRCSRARYACHVRIGELDRSVIVLQKCRHITCTDPAHALRTAVKALNTTEFAMIRLLGSAIYQ